MAADLARILVHAVQETDPSAGAGTHAATLRPRDLHRTLPGYAVTPLHAMESLAADLGLDGIWVKDESWRLDLPSFKILGGSWAVHRLVLARAGRPAEGAGFAELRAAAAEIGPLTLTTATDGNHGRGVARAARLLGFDAVVYVPTGTAQARLDAIAGEGATVVVHDGDYDAAVDRAAAEARVNGWEVVADVARGGDDEVPAWVMDGYDTIFDEADEQLPAPATAIFVQAGVGALTGAALRHHLRIAGDGRGDLPRFATVEPVTAACLLASAEAGALRSIQASHDSIMAGLNCGTPSSVAWPLIAATVSVYLAVPDTRTEAAMRLLAEEGIVAGESGAAGLAGLLEALEHPDARTALQLDDGARVLLLNTEGATDPQGYERIVGRSAEAVRDGAARSRS
jgi:diaminopropionate ammonia-lyase